MDISSLIDNARSCDGVRFSAMPLEFSSLGDLLDRRAREDASRTWIVFYDAAGQRTEISYGDFTARVASVAGFLQQAGLRLGDRVATVAHNHADTVVQYFAAWWLGLTLVPVNVTEDDARVEYILRNSGCKIAFVRSEYAERIAGIAEGIETPLSFVLVSGDGPGDNSDPHGKSSVNTWVRFESIVDSTAASLADPLDAPLREPVRDLADQECLIVYTSGTTGHPKGVVLTHGNLLADAEGISQWHKITPDSTMMCVLPIHHVNGTVVTIVTPLFAGGRVVLNHKYQTSTFFDRLARERVEVVSVVPTLLAFLVQGDVDIAGLDLSHLRHIICGAGPLTCELAQRFEERYGVPIIHGYGLSETTCYSCFLPISLPTSEHQSWLLDYGFPSIGQAIPQNEMDIQSDQGVSVAEGERGEIVIRGHNVMRGYYNNDSANRDAFSWGWFRSGDEGFFRTDAKGDRYFFITGRLKELIIRGGVNVSPLEIDEVLNSHPGVHAAIAVGFEHVLYGEEIGAYVHRTDPSLSEADILVWCQEHLPFFKCPKVVIFGEEIPVTSTGKYQRNRVKHLFTNFRSEQFSEGESSPAARRNE